MWKIILQVKCCLPKTVTSISFHLQGIRRWKFPCSTGLKADGNITGCVREFGMCLFASNQSVFMTCNRLQTLVKLLNCLLKFFDWDTFSLDTPQHLLIQDQFGNTPCRATSWCQAGVFYVLHWQTEHRHLNRVVSKEHYKRLNCRYVSSETTDLWKINSVDR